MPLTWVPDDGRSPPPIKHKELIEVPTEDLIAAIRQQQQRESDEAFAVMLVVLGFLSYLTGMGYFATDIYQKVWDVGGAIRLKHVGKTILWPVWLAVQFGRAWWTGTKLVGSAFYNTAMEFRTFWKTNQRRRRLEDHPDEAVEPPHFGVNR